MGGDNRGKGGYKGAGVILKSHQGVIVPHAQVRDCTSSVICLQGE